MSGSITTAIPSGYVNTPDTGPNYTGPKWCIYGLIDVFAHDGPPYTYNECANSTRGETKSDFETICCDGEIIDKTHNLWSGSGSLGDYQLDVDNLVCCRAGGQKVPGGINPIDPDQTHCSASYVPEPLASLAATNSENAALYTVVYESAKGLSDGSWTDWTRTESPTCLWVQTAGGEITVPLQTVTVAAAQITTLPPPSTDMWGNTVTPSTGMSGSATRSGDAPSRASGSGVPTSSQASSGAGRGVSLSSVIVAVGLPLLAMMGSGFAA